MDVTLDEVFQIQADIGDHRHRVARLLENVDALRRSIAELGVTTLTGRTGATILCTSRIRAGDVAMGEVAAHFEYGPSSSSRGRRPRAHGMTAGHWGTRIARGDLPAHY
jgi:hypothetical protein